MSAAGETNTRSITQVLEKPQRFQQQSGYKSDVQLTI